VPDRRDVDAVEVSLLAVLGQAGPHLVARLEADLGPQARWTAYLRLLRGQARVAVGTRACAFAPVTRLGLVAIWDDGDDQHADPRAPYPHAREVLRLRAEQTGAGALLGAWSRSVEAAALLAQGWARPVEADRATRRSRWPRVTVASDGRPDDDPAARSARMPPAAWRAVHDGLARGPVLVQVVRAGYLPGLSCDSCRRPARCPHCQGPVAMRASSREPSPPPGAEVPGCGWCGRGLPGWQCPHCQGRRLRARSVGVDRTAEELGRAFPRAGVLVSRPDRNLPRVPADRPVLVLATAGVEPPVAGGYAAAVLLDGDALLERADLRAGEEALRRWRAAAALVRPATERGLVVVAADPAAPAVQALVRADPGGFAERELTERQELALPPAAAVATLDGPPGAVRALLDLVHVPEGTGVLGPVPHVPDRPPTDGAKPAGGAGPAGADGPSLDGAETTAVRVVLRAPRDLGGQLAQALREAVAVRSARRDAGSVRVCLDPRDLG
jgi:primosomal protein N' (replication factor Y) (superfamily II helicase)